MAVKFSNNAFATLGSSLTNVATTLSLSAGQGARFPSLGTGDYFYATLVDASNNQEIIKVTARATDTLTIVRAQEGTSARAFSAGDRIELRVTAGALEAIGGDAQEYIDGVATSVGDDLNDHINDTTAAHAASAVSFSATGNVSSTNVQAAIAELDTEKVPTTRSVATGTGLSGGGNLSADRTLAIADTGVTAGSYGSSSAIPTFSVNAQGQLTAAGSTAITIRSISLETANASFGNDTTISIPSNTFLIVGTCLVYMGGSSGGRMSVQFRNSGGSVIQEILAVGGNESNGTDGGSGMYVRGNFAIGVPSGTTSIRIYNSSGSNGIGGTIYQYLKFA